MSVNELLQKFDFHDSNITEISFKEEMLIIKMDFCMWKQNGYHEGEKELKETRLEFLNVNKCIWDSQKSQKDIEYGTILGISYSDEKNVKIVLMDDDISILSFECDSVDFNF